MLGGDDPARNQLSLVWNRKIQSASDVWVSPWWPRIKNPSPPRCFGNLASRARFIGSFCCATVTMVGRSMISPWISRSSAFTRSWPEVFSKIARRPSSTHPSKRVRWQVLQSTPEPVGAVHPVVVQAPLVVPVVLPTPPTRVVGLEFEQVIADLNDTGGPLGIVVVHPYQECEVVGGSGLLVVVAEVHLHRDLPTAEVLGELAIDFVPIDLPVEVGAVGDVEFDCEPEFHLGAQVGLLRLVELLVAPSARALPVEQFVQGVAEHPGESLKTVWLLFEPTNKTSEGGGR